MKKRTAALTVAALTTAAVLAYYGSKFETYYSRVYNGPKQPNSITFYNAKSNVPADRKELPKIVESALEKANKLGGEGAEKREYSNRFFVTPSEVMKKGKGDCWDKTAVALKELREANVDARPKILKLVYEKDAANHVAILVVLDGVRSFVDPQEGVWKGEKDYFAYLAGFQPPAKFGKLLAIEGYPLEKRHFPNFLDAATDSKERKAAENLKPEFVFRVP